MKDKNAIDGVKFARAGAGAEDDVDAFFPFFKKSIEGYFDFSRLELAVENTMQANSEEGLKQSIIIDKSKILYLALCGDEVVGYAMVGDEPGGVSFVFLMAVHEEYRKKGIATAFLSLWEEEAKERGIHLLRLNTDREDNAHFYSKRGFCCYGCMLNSWYNATVWCFSKQI